MKYLIIALGAVIFVIVRTFIFLLNRLSQNNLINKLKKNPARASDYIGNLDIPYSTRNDFNVPAYDLVKSKIQAEPFIDNYKILYSMEINSSQFLVFTELSFVDFDTTLTGRSSDVNKKAYHNFLFTHRPTDQTLQVSSNLHNTATEKFQKEEFMIALLKSNISLK